MADKETVETLIGPETRVSGELRGDQDVVVRGRVEGRVSLTSILTVEEGAIVQADVEARVVLISGVVVGNVTATESVRLQEKARVVGDLTAPRVVMEAGAAFRGRLEMGEGAEAAATSRASARRPVERENREPARTAPPRLAPPSRLAQTPGAITRATSAPAAPARPAGPPTIPPAAPARAPAAPPALPRPGVAAATGIATGPGAPSWAKKKLQRRR